MADNDPSVGGTVNLIPKRATDDPITRLTTGLYAAARAEYDLNDFWTPYGAYGRSKSEEFFSVEL